MLRAAVDYRHAHASETFAKASTGSGELLIAQVARSAVDTHTFRCHLKEWTSDIGRAIRVGLPGMSNPVVLADEALKSRKKNGKNLDSSSC